MSSETPICNDVTDNTVMHPTCRELLRTWDRLRAEKSAPRRADITLRDLKSIAPWVCILQREPSKPAYTWRLAGSAISETWGRKLTGKHAFADWRSFDRETMVRALDAVVGMKQPAVGRFIAYSFSGSEVGFEFAAVPVVARNGSDIHVMAAISAVRDLRTGLCDPLVDFRVRQLRVLWNDDIATRPAIPHHQPTSIHVNRINSSFLRVINGGKS
jgi:hypothetical protein